MAPRKQLVAGPSKKARVEAEPSSRARTRPEIPVEPHHPPPRENLNVCLKMFFQLKWVDFADLADALPTLMCMFFTLGWDSFL